MHPVLSLHPPRRPPCRRRSYDHLVHRAPPPPSTLLDLLPRRRQPSLPQHRQILSRCVHGAAPEAVLFRICSTYLSQQENRSPLLYILNKVIYSLMARTEYKTIAMGKMEKWICLSSHHLTQGGGGLSLSLLVSDPDASHPPAEREDVHRFSVRQR